jgi:hypothetical protein
MNMAGNMIQGLRMVGKGSDYDSDHPSTDVAQRILRGLFLVSTPLTVMVACAMKKQIWKTENSVLRPCQVRV